MRFDWHNPYSMPRKPMFARNVVATSQPLATLAGLRILAQGGNAVDAAIAGRVHAYRDRPRQQRFGL